MSMQRSENAWRPKITARKLLFPLCWLLTIFTFTGETQPQIKSFPSAQADEEFTVPVTIVLNGADEDAITFGTRIGATDDFDLGIDVLNPPPPPNRFDAYFQIAAQPLLSKLAEDYRLNTITSHTWTLIITATEGSTGVMSWDASGFPSGGTTPGLLEIRNADSVLVDMLSDTSFNFAGDQNLTIFYEAPLFCISDGDVNNDGNLTPGDALCAFKIFLNGQNVPAECDIADWDCEVIAGDVNCDGTVTPGDALSIFQRFLSGLPPEKCFAQAGLSLSKRSSRAEPYRLSLVQRTVLQSAEASGRDLIKLSLRVDHPEGLTAFGLGLSYPAEKLDFVGIRRTALTQEWIELDGQVAEPGELLIGGFSIEAVEAVGAGDLFELTFASKGQSIRADEFGIIELTDDISDALLSAEASGLFGVATVPTAFKLYQSYPNPFQSHSAQDAVIRFDLAGSEAMQVELSIYNITGQLVRRLVTGSRTPGQYEISWDGRNDSGLQLPSGTYFYRLKAADFVDSRYLSVVR